jgi:chromosome segregation ATPase
MAMSEDSNSTGQPTPPEEGIELRVKRIQEKLQLLLRQRDLLLKENGRLKDELQQLQQTQNDQSLRLDQLQQQVEVLKVTKTAMSEGEKKALEKKLGQYIREIDRCITLLGQ